MSDAEDARRMALDEICKRVRKHEPSTKVVYHRPSGMGWATHGYSRMEAMGMNRHWIVSFKMRVYDSNTIGTLKYHCQDFEAKVMDYGRIHLTFTVRRLANTATAAMVEANDWVYELLFREGGEEQMADCRVVSLSVEALHEFRDRLQKRNELITLQEQVMSYNKSNPLYGGFPSNWDTSGFDVTMGDIIERYEDL